MAQVGNLLVLHLLYKSTLTGFRYYPLLQTTPNRRSCTKLTQEFLLALLVSSLFRLASLLSWYAYYLAPINKWAIISHFSVDCQCYRLGVASFPGSPCTQMKNGKERGEPGKIYHVRNVIGRENLITCGRTNELAHALLTEYTHSVAKALWLTERD